MSTPAYLGAVEEGLGRAEPRTVRAVPALLAPTAGSPHAGRSCWRARP